MKGTVNVILSEPPSTELKAQFTTVPVKPWSEKQWGGYRCFSILNFKLHSLSLMQYGNVRFITEKSYFSGCTWSTGKLKRTLVRYACNLEFLSTQFSVWNLGIFQSSMIRSRFKVHTVCLLFIPLYKWRITWNHAIGPFNSGLAQINQ